MPLGWQICMQDGGRGLSYAMAAYFMQSLDGRVFARFISAYKFVHLSALVGSFLLWIIRSAFTSSLISTNGLGRQIDNVEDFLQSSLRIMLTETEVEMYFTPGHLPQELQHRLVVVNTSTLQEHLRNRNTSYAYCITSELWSIINLLQKPLFRPLFRRASPELCTPKFIKLIPMQRNSPFRKHFSFFYISLHRFGFMPKWFELSFMQAKKIGLLKLYRDEKLPFRGVILKDLTLPLKTYGVLCGFCILCLICEIVWKHRVQLRRARINIKI